MLLLPLCYYCYYLQYSSSCCCKRLVPVGLPGKGTLLICSRPPTASKGPLGGCITNSTLLCSAALLGSLPLLLCWEAAAATPSSHTAATFYIFRICSFAKPHLYRRLLRLGGHHYFFDFYYSCHTLTAAASSLTDLCTSIFGGSNTQHNNIRDTSPDKFNSALRLVKKKGNRSGFCVALMTFTLALAAECAFLAGEVLLQSTTPTALA